MSTCDRQNWRSLQSTLRAEHTGLAAAGKMELLFPPRKGGSRGLEVWVTCPTPHELSGRQHGCGHLVQHQGPFHQDPAWHAPFSLRHCPWRVAPSLETQLPMKARAQAAHQSPACMQVLAVLRQTVAPDPGPVTTPSAREAKNSWQSSGAWPLGSRAEEGSPCHSQETASVPQDKVASEEARHCSVSSHAAP